MNVIKFFAVKTTTKTFLVRVIHGSEVKTPQGPEWTYRKNTLEVQVGEKWVYLAAIIPDLDAEVIATEVLELLGELYS